MDDGAKSVTVDGEGVSLTPIEYNILLLLMRHPGRVFSTSQIYERVWNDPSLGSENTVAVHIRHLREKLEIDPANPGTSRWCGAWATRWRRREPAPGPPAWKDKGMFGRKSMKRAFTSPGGSAGLFLAGVVLCGVAFWAGLITISQWDNLWVGGSYTDSYSITRIVRLYDYYAGEIAGLIQQGKWEGTLSYTDQKRLDNLKDLLSPEKSNYRVEVHTQDGALLYTNLPEGTSMDSLSAVTLWEQTLSRGEELWEGDYTVYDEESDRSGLMIYLGEDQYVYSDPSQYVGQYNGYGYRGDSEGLGWAGSYRQGMDSRVETVTCTIQSGVQWPLTAEDYFQTDYADYQLFQEYLPAIAGVAAVTLLCALCASGPCAGPPAIAEKRRRSI